MKLILISVFLLTIIPYLGLPRLFDMWITLSFMGIVIYALYRYVQTHDVRLKLPKNMEDDFFEQNKEEISPELGQDNTDEK